MKKLRFGLMAAFAIAIGLYPAVYFIFDRRFGLLQSKSEALLSDWVWNTGFYTHIILGGVALLSGWSQFSTSIRARHLQLHRNLGKLYVACVLLSSVAGIYIGFFATGGFVAAAGFICLGAVWFSSTLFAYRSVLRKDTETHQRMMMYSYGACFAAVTLRIWLPILMLLFEDFERAYRIVAWLCWVPNILVTHWLVMQLPEKSVAKAASA
ncbi:MAG: DUF2306 domain-containing protein [Bacteroidetes bacterium]|nr:DUF2306 domain-containing protein [Bacteroidota bacterium]